VREAIRGLTLIGLAEARHGSGTYVTTDTAQLMSLLFGTMISLDRIGAREVLAVLGALNEMAAISAARNATEGERETIAAALRAFDSVDTADAAAEAVRGFHAAIAAASHNLLLETLCRFLTGVQVKLAATLADGALEVWRAIFADLATVREALVAAILAGDPDAAGVSARSFGQAASQAVVSLPGAKAVRARDPSLSGLLSALLAARPLA
jgi:Transcriptional regulators